MGNYEKKDLLLEVGCEELPSRFIPGALKQLQENTASLMGDYRLNFDRAEAWGTPRRLVLLVKGLASRQPPLQQKVKGPPLERAYDATGAPTAALHGFARSHGLSPEALIVEKVKGSPYLFAVKELPGKAAELLLPEILTQLLRGISFSRPMYWERKEDRFPRPVRWLVAFYGSTPVRFTFAGVDSGTATFGHRFLSPGSFTVDSVAGYFNCLERNRVILDHERRRELIRQQLFEKAAAVGGQPLLNEALLEEVTFLVEYPVAVSGSFDRDYLELPREVLITTMQVHQRYFPVVREDDGALKPYFIGISNNRFHKNIRRGYEKVLGARLADARFFYNEDIKEPLESYAGQLADVIFHEALGTLAEKQERLVKLVGTIGEHLGLSGKHIRRAKRAAQLCKADLVTHMVREFPELQGVMGREYALLSGEEPETAAAIYEHYRPRHFGDAVPSTIEGALLSLADRADTLSGCFAAGIQPTGSQDPYALRRQGQGIIAVLMAYEFDLTPAALLDAALREHVKAVPLSVQRRKSLQGALHDFMTHRLRFALQEKGLSYDVIEAVLAVPYRSVAELFKRAAALEKHLRTDLLKDLHAAYIRVTNLSRQTRGGAVQQELLGEPAEKELYLSLLQVEPRLEQALQQCDYKSCFELLGLLKEPVDCFFDQVLVMVEDEKLRLNRLNLLASVKSLFNRLADFSLLQLAG
ncbi:MAG TPA: glycine--tRNA ligase subunit beta [Bacillota bacterium]|nr:glycine--tRNA ligase subunit beta [Bacillota bacterium]HPZ41834.1 glycine--tRNA ligase subunit beta [Bacillota bacterium]HQD52726.1 glycine--tRNA ligase subunit beta [Bacillota bacterium]